jgi:CheY-like chemotaxis protein
MKIVAIDDSATNLVILRNLCSRIVGAECITYADSEQALEHLVANDAAKIILDYSMPKITGVELVKRLRVTLRHGMTPIVMVTGSTEMAVRRRAVKVGVTPRQANPGG